MRERTDKSKQKIGRGVILPDSYEAWKTAREAKSLGTACAFYDPIQQRTINCLSQGEVKVFWIMRFYPSVTAIYEQVPLKKEIMDEICAAIPCKKYSRILSTDFLVQKDMDSFVAISVKKNKDGFLKRDKNYDKRIRRTIVEQKYWEQAGVPFHLIFSDDFSLNVSKNIRDAMFFWDDHMVTDASSMLMHMIAHHVIVFEIPDKRINYKKLANELSVEELYETYQKNKYNPEFHGWKLDLS